MQKPRLFLHTLIALAALFGLYAAARRFSAEKNNRAVEIAIDMAEVQKLAVAEGKSVEVVLTAFRDAGVTSVALAEDTISSLEESRRIEIVSTPNRNTTYMVVHQGNYARVITALRNRTNLQAMLSTPAGVPDNARTMDVGIDVHYPYNLLHTIGVGLDPELVKSIKDCKLNLVGRIENNENTPEAGIDWALQQLHEQGASTIIFAGDEILGYDGHLELTKTALRKYGLNFGIVEFGKIKGDDQLHRLVPDRTVRVHTVTGAEMATASPGDNIQRFSLAARERNIRLLYVRLFLSKTNPLEVNTRYLQSLSQSLSRSGLTVNTKNPAHPYGPLSSPIWVKAALGVGLAAGFLLLVDALCGFLTAPKNPVTVPALAAACGLALLAVIPVGGQLPVRLAALAAACIFPTLALLDRTLLKPLPWDESLWATLFSRLVRVLATTAIGMIFVVGLLADRVYLVKADVFVGIKLGLYLPLLVAVLAWTLELRAETPALWYEALGRQFERAKALVNDPLRLGQVFAGLAVVVVLGLLWLRSGNEGTAVVSGAELKFRDLLDRYLFVRPRFKANLFAAFLLGLYFALRGNRKLGIPFFLLGIIAVTDFLNTFCHLHTPLLVSALRDVIGLVIGVGLGSIAIVLLERRRRTTKRSEDAR